MRDIANSKGKSVTDKDYSRPGAPIAMPVMFGANFNDDPVLRQNLKKSHTLAQRPKLTEKAAQEDPAHTLYDYLGREDVDPRFASARSRSLMTTKHAKKTMTLNGEGLTGKVGATSPTASATATNIFEQQLPTLHFLGYFVEHVPESADETARVRKVAVNFFTEDGTLSVREARQENSGIVQGNILMRQLVPKSYKASQQQQHLTARDLSLGSTVNIYGKEITLVDCDAATRAYQRDVLGRASVPESGDILWPADLDKYNQLVKDKTRVEARRILPTGDMDNRRAVESLLSGGVITKHAPDDIRTAQQFFANRINERLTFCALHDERHRLSGDLNDVVIRYYLENDQVEIVSAKKENAGRDPGNKLLQRQRVPSTRLARQPPLGSVTTTFQQAPYGLLLKTDGQFLTHKELQVGETVEIFNKKYFIYDADSFTRKWMHEHGCPLSDRVDTAAIRDPPPKQYEIAVPPHTGFGSDEDGMQSCRSLAVKPPKIDHVKRAREAGKVLLHRAVLAPKSTALRSAAQGLDPEDEGREFLIRFFCDTDEIEIQERHIRNSGIVGGRFLAKGRYKKKAPGQLDRDFRADDFVVGQVVTVTGRDFLLTELDAKSRRVVLGVEEDGSPASPARSSEQRIAQLIVDLKEHLNAKFARAHEAFHFLCSTAGMITPRDIQRFFEQASGSITYEEAVAIVNYFDEHDDNDGDAAAGPRGVVTFKNFCRMMGFASSDDLDEAANNIRAVQKKVRQHQLATASASAAAGNIDDDESSPMRRALARTSAADAQVRTRHLRKQFVDKMVQRRGTVQEIFRVLCGHESFALMTRANFLKSLVDILHLRLDPSDLQLLEHELYKNSQNPRGLSLKEFSQFVEDTP